MHKDSRNQKILLNVLFTLLTLVSDAVCSTTTPEVRQGPTSWRGVSRKIVNKLSMHISPFSDYGSSESWHSLHPELTDADLLALSQEGERERETFMGDLLVDERVGLWAHGEGI